MGFMDFFRFNGRSEPGIQELGADVTRDSFLDNLKFRLSNTALHGTFSFLNRAFDSVLGLGGRAINGVLGVGGNVFDRVVGMGGRAFDFTKDTFSGIGRAIHSTFTEGPQYHQPENAWNDRSPDMGYNHHQPAVFDTTTGNVHISRGNSQTYDVVEDGDLNVIDRITNLFTSAAEGKNVPTQATMDNQLNYSTPVLGFTSPRV